MGVSNELARPESEEKFEAMCHALYRRMWNDTGCMRMGGPGQSQFGVDIIGHDGNKSVGIQCKHYNKKSFTLSAITSDIKKAEQANLDIQHLLFATSAPSKSTLVKEVHDLSATRRKDGKFTVSVDFWGDISGHILIYPEIGKAYIPNFPGTPTLEIKETLSAHLSLYGSDQEAARQFQVASINNQNNQSDKLDAILQRLEAPEALGDEADPRVVTSLDFIRDKLRAGKSREAEELLLALGEPGKLRDQYSQFRWHTNHASVALLEGKYDAAAAEFLEAFHLAPDDEKAHANRARALLLKKDPAAALAASEESLGKFPDSVLLWPLKLNARQLLGQPAPDRDLPVGLRDSPDILLTLAGIKSAGGDYPGALVLLRQCMAVNVDSFDAKRFFLADALSWANLDPVMAHHGQLTTGQREALADAVQRLEPLEQTLPAIQSDQISHEVTSNVSMALTLLGRKDRARTLTTHSLVRHPLSEGLLRLKLTELDEQDNVAAIHALTDARLTELPPPVLGILAEISANRGALSWHTEVLATAEKSGLPPQWLQELRVLSIHAQWVAGDRTAAVEAARSHLQAHPEHILGRVILGQMLQFLGQKSNAIQQAMNCLDRLADDAPSLDVRQVADLFFDLHQFRDAGTLYSRLVKVPGNDDFTRRMLICLVESDQRCRAQNTLNQLPPDVQALPRFRRIAANLARRMADWPRMRDLLTPELEQRPDDSSIALGYIGALHQLDDKPALLAYLESDPRFKDSSPENEFEFSKYQDHYGLSGLAIARMYRLYRANSGNARAASLYLFQVLLGRRIPELEAPAIVGPGAVVSLRGRTETRMIGIDIEVTKSDGGWPELVLPNSDLAKHLLGLKQGDKVTLTRNFGDQTLDVVGIESLYSFVARKAHQQVEAAAVPAGPLWSVRVIKEDGKLDIDALLKPAQQRREQVSSIFENYRQYRFPISLLAKMVGSDPVTLLMDWPFHVTTLFVGIGTHEERAAATTVLRQGGHRYVLDLLSIAEFVQRKSFDAVVKLLGRPLVPQTVRTHLLGLMLIVGRPRPSASLGEQNGHLTMSDTPASYYEHREAILHEMLRCIDHHCDLMPTAGPRDVTDTHRFLGEVLDSDSLDVLYLCIERDGVLVSDDGALRLLAPGAGVVNSIGVQPVLMEACGKGLFSKEAYADAVVGKLAAGHDFVSVRADDLLTLAKRTPSRVSEDVRTALDAFRKATLDIESGVLVCHEFLRQASQLLSPTLVGDYRTLVLEVLKFNRPQIADELQRLITGSTLRSPQQGPGAKSKLKNRHTPPNLFDDPAQPNLWFRRTPIRMAILELFYLRRW